MHRVFLEAVQIEQNRNAKRPRKEYDLLPSPEGFLEKGDLL